MPTYAYRCNECGYEFEVRQRMMDDPLTECPECEGEIRRVVNSVGVVFKGSGFYITDNRNGRKDKSKPSTTTSTSTESAAGSETTPAKETKSESKKTPEKADKK